MLHFRCHLRELHEKTYSANFSTASIKLIWFVVSMSDDVSNSVDLYWHVPLIFYGNPLYFVSKIILDVKPRHHHYHQHMPIHQLLLPTPGSPFTAPYTQTSMMQTPRFLLKLAFYKLTMIDNDGEKKKGSKKDKPYQIPRKLLLTVHVMQFL